MKHLISIAVVFAVLAFSSAAFANGNGDDMQFFDITPHVVEGEFVEPQVDNYTVTEGSTFENLYQLEQPSFMGDILTDSETLD